MDQYDRTARPDQFDGSPADIGTDRPAPEDASGPAPWIDPVPATREPLPGLRHDERVRPIVKAMDGLVAVSEIASGFQRAAAAAARALNGHPDAADRIAKQLPPTIMAAMAARMKEATGPITRALLLSNGNTVCDARVHATIDTVIDRARDRFRKAMADYALPVEGADTVIADFTECLHDAMAEFTGGIDWQMPPVIPYTPMLDDPAVRATLGKSESELAAEGAVNAIADAHDIRSS